MKKEVAFFYFQPLPLAQEGQDLGTSAHGAQPWLSASFRPSPALLPASQVSFGGGLGSVSFRLHRPSSQFPRLACPHLIPWTCSDSLCPSWWCPGLSPGPSSWPCCARWQVSLSMKPECSRHSQNRKSCGRCPCSCCCCLGALEEQVPPSRVAGPLPLSLWPQLRPPQPCPQSAAPSRGWLPQPVRSLLAAVPVAGTGGLLAEYGHRGLSPTDPLCPLPGLTGYLASCLSGYSPVDLAPPPPSVTLPHLSPRPSVLISYMKIGTWG